MYFLRVERNRMTALISHHNFHLLTLERNHRILIEADASVSAKKNLSGDKPEVHKASKKTTVFSTKREYFGRCPYFQR